MPDHKYLIVGGGMSADAAVKGIRRVDPAGTIGIIAAEPHRPYNRPPLSKALWKGEPLSSVWRDTPAANITFFLSTTAVRLDLANNVAFDDRGASHSWGSLLLATGGTVRKLPFDVEGVIYFRTLDDYERLRALAEPGRRFVVIGGGFIGSEVAAALTMNGCNVTMVFPEDGIGARVYPPSLTQFLNSHYRSKGVVVMAKDGVAGIERRSSGYFVHTTSGKTIEADAVVAGIGISPNTELASAAGLAVDNGIVVDEFLRTSRPGVYAAGDVANFVNPALGKRIRVEHEDNAITMGGVAGENMAGSAVPYRHLPFFYSDLFELGYEAVGELDSRMEIVEAWKEPFREGVLYFLSGGRVRGVVLWNVWGQVDRARELIAEAGPLDAASVRGRI